MAHVLVVDDEEGVRKLARKLLESSGHTVTVAFDGESALEVFDAVHPDLVVTDLIMPLKGGLALIKDLREKYPEQKILAISGGGKDGRQNYLSTARLYPDVKTLSKPFTLIEFGRTVEAMLRG